MIKNHTLIQNQKIPSKRSISQLQDQLKDVAKRIIKLAKKSEAFYRLQQICYVMEFNFMQNKCTYADLRVWINTWLSYSEEIHSNYDPPKRARKVKRTYSTLTQLYIETSELPEIAGRCFAQLDFDRFGEVEKKTWDKMCENIGTLKEPIHFITERKHPIIYFQTASRLFKKFKEGLNGRKVNGIATDAFKLSALAIAIKVIEDDAVYNVDVTDMLNFPYDKKVMYLMETFFLETIDFNVVPNL